MQTITLNDFNSQCLAFIEQLANTKETITLTKQGKPIAKISPVVEETNDIIGLFKDEITINGDITKPVLTEQEWELL